MSRILLTLILCASFSLIQASPGSTERDSITACILALPPDSTRLDKIVEVARTNQMSPDFVHYSLMLLDEAKEQGNMKMVCKAYYFLLVFHYNNQDLKKVVELLEEMKPIALEENAYYEYFNGQRYYIELLALNENYEYAVDEALKMKREAVQLNNNSGIIAANISLATSYGNTGRHKEAAGFLEEALVLAPDSDLISRTAIVQHALSVYFEMKDEANCLRMLHLFDKITDTLAERYPESMEGYADLFLYKNVVYTYCYIWTKDHARALEYKEKSESYFSAKSFFMYQVYYYMMLSEFYLEFESPEQAIEANDKALEMVKEDYSLGYLTLLSKKAELMIAAGRAQEAISIYKVAIPAFDSISQVTSKNQLQQIRTNYDLESSLLTKAQTLNRRRILILIACLFFLIILVYGVRKLLFLRNAIHRSAESVKKDRLVEEKNNELKTLFLQNISHNIRVPLNSVVGFSELLSNDPDMDKELRREYSEIIRRNSETLMYLISDILDLSRLESGRMKFTMGNQDLILVCHESVHPTEGYNKQEVAFEFPEELCDKSIFTDNNRIIEVLSSVLYGPKGILEKRWEEEVQMKIKRDENGKYVEFVITNSPLANSKYAPERTIIRNEINRLLLQNWKGSYTVLSDDKTAGIITIRYPLG